MKKLGNYKWAVCNRCGERYILGNEAHVCHDMKSSEKSQSSYPTYSDDEYVGYTNEAVKVLRRNIANLKKETEEKIKEMTKEIDDIQSKCIHVYKQDGNGPYETYYTCSECGYNKPCKY